MTSAMLPIIRASAEFDIEQMLPLVITGKIQLERILGFCRNYRRRGICSLFWEGLPQLLHRDLQKSGAAFSYFLKTVRNTEKITSKAAPFFDALACRDFDTARELSRNSRHSWNQEEEYEDDFLYVFFVMKKFFLDGTDQEMWAILSRYEDLLDGADDARLDLCKSFLENDDSTFAEALNALITQHEEYYRRGIERDEILEEEWATEGQLFVEGLALVRLAEVQGFRTDRNYLFIPSIAIDHAPVGFDADSWKNLHE
jgi:hypothetical protein